MKSVLTDKELVRDYGSGFQQRSDLVFQTDFTSQQYKDIGPDQVPLWRTGSEAHCANVVSAARLNQDGAYVRQDLLSFTQGFSVCARFYPDYSSLTKQTLYSLGSSGTLLSLYMEADSEHRYYLCAMIGDQVLRSTMEIHGLLWHDAALAVNLQKGEAALYLDGEPAASCSVSCSGFTDTRAVIGAEYFTDRPVYDRGFAGFLDYVAEFSKAISPEEAADMIEHEPYFYNEGIQSLLLFGWGEPRDAIQGKNLAEYGAGYFTMAADTMPLESPTGVGWQVPQEADEAYWNSLTDNQKWALTLYILLVAQTLDGAAGIQLLADGGEDFAIVHRRYNDPGALAVLAWAAGVSEDEDLSALLEDDTPDAQRLQEVFRRSSPEAWFSAL